MISFRNVSKTYKNGTHALYNITLDIRDGEFVYIIGKTGSGKSTLIKLLNGE
ncbi:MAG: ATP-binding cassette domain-containing protein, partial [Erysipelotrichaceae bacterium]|nr:ATP-binding cassette domain-containing protein [Erysipelotrichaceae bacterium]